MTCTAAAITADADARYNRLFLEGATAIMEHNRATAAAQGDPEAIAAADATLRAATASINARR
jgi:hypothetical protein